MSRSKQKIDFSKQRLKISRNANKHHPHEACNTSNNKGNQRGRMAAFVIIPTKTVSVECIQVIWMSIKRRIFTSGHKRNMLISPPIFTLFQNFFFLNERSHFDHYLDLKIRFRKKLSTSRYTVTLKRRREIEFVLPSVNLISVNTYVLKKNMFQV